MSEAGLYFSLSWTKRDWAVRMENMTFPPTFILTSPFSVLFLSVLVTFYFRSEMYSNLTVKFPTLGLRRFFPKAVLESIDREIRGQSEGKESFLSWLSCLNTGSCLEITPAALSSVLNYFWVWYTLSFIKDVTYVICLIIPGYWFLLPSRFYI